MANQWIIRERDRRYRRDEDDYRRNMERSSRRRQVFDGDNVSITVVDGSSIDRYNDLAQ